MSLRSFLTKDFSFFRHKLYTRHSQMKMALGVLWDWTEQQTLNTNKQTCTHTHINFFF